MKLAIIGPYFSSSGTSRHVTNIFHGLRKIHKDKTILITFKELNETKPQIESRENIHVYPKIPEPTLFKNLSEFIVQIVLKYEIDVLLPQIKPFILLCTAMARNQLTEQGHTSFIIGTWHSNFSWITKAPYHLAMSVIAANQSDAFIPVSKNVVESLQNILQIDPTHIKPIIPPGGIDFNLIATKRSHLLGELKTRFAISENYIIFLGRLLYNKGLDTLIQAFSKLNYSGKLVIIGSGPYKNEIDVLIQQKGIENRIVFTDFISDEKVYALLQGADLYCLPSRWESFSISTLEAMAAGLPIVCSKVGGLQYWTAGVAIQVNPDDVDGFATQMDKILHDKDLETSLGEKSSRLAQEYDYQIIAEKTLDSINQVVSETKSLQKSISTNSEVIFDETNGVIELKKPHSNRTSLKKLLITRYALFFPSEALENEDSESDSSEKYYANALIDK
ncbi:MAG: glycosyltransferase family 4 protein [Candidatus Heimdallarchaeota archaeon]|nr:glycosyltransferase family 4 protein [Candidatus Heimdallarchaeota archaeon]